MANVIHPLISDAGEGEKKREEGMSFPRGHREQREGRMKERRKKGRSPDLVQLPSVGKGGKRGKKELGDP